MTTRLILPQGRAPGLYDEQLQRELQEKSLIFGFAPGPQRGLLGKFQRKSDAEAAKRSSKMSDTERGQPASLDRRTGEVHGSGVDAGGSGPGREDYDQDPMAGSGEKPPHGPRTIDTAVDRPIDPDEGV